MKFAIEAEDLPEALPNETKEPSFLRDEFTGNDYKEIHFRADSCRPIPATSLISGVSWAK